MNFFSILLINDIENINQPSLFLHLCSGSSVWVNSEPHNQKHLLNQSLSTNPAPPKRPSVVSNKDTVYGNANYSYVPTVSFDLGNEWDDWDDFDDENLVRASETCLVSHAGPIQKSVDTTGKGKFDKLICGIEAHILHF